MKRYLISQCKSAFTYDPIFIATEDDSGYFDDLEDLDDLDDLDDLNDSNIYCYWWDSDDLDDLDNSNILLWWPWWF